MAQTTCIPLVPPIGYLRGRDAVYLDAIHWERPPGAMILEGDCYGAHASEAPDPSQFYAYTLRFDGVLAFHVTKLDSWLHL